MKTMVCHLKMRMKLNTIFLFVGRDMLCDVRKAISRYADFLVMISGTTTRRIIPFGNRRPMALKLSMLFRNKLITGRYMPIFCIAILFSLSKWWVMRNATPKITRGDFKKYRQKRINIMWGGPCRVIMKLSCLRIMAWYAAFNHGIAIRAPKMKCDYFA